MLPVAMLASGVLSALMFTPNLLLISDLARRGHGEGLFGRFRSPVRLASSWGR